MRPDSNRWLRDSLGGLALTFALLAGLAMPVGNARGDLIDNDVPTCVAACMSDGNSSSDCFTACTAAAATGGALSYCTFTPPPNCPGWCITFFLGRVCDETLNELFVVVCDCDD